MVSNLSILMHVLFTLLHMLRFCAVKGHPISRVVHGIDTVTFAWNPIVRFHILKSRSHILLAVLCCMFLLIVGGWGISALFTYTCALLLRFHLGAMVFMVVENLCLMDLR